MNECKKGKKNVHEAEKVSIHSPTPSGCFPHVFLIHQGQKGFLPKQRNFLDNLARVLCMIFFPSSSLPIVVDGQYENMRENKHFSIFSIQILLRRAFYYGCEGVKKKKIRSRNGSVFLLREYFVNTKSDSSTKRGKHYKRTFQW
jgi:hypothetical protein